MRFSPDGGAKYDKVVMSVALQVGDVANLQGHAHDHFIVLRAAIRAESHPHAPGSVDTPTGICAGDLLFAQSQARTGKVPPRVRLRGPRVARRTRGKLSCGLRQ